MEQQKYLEPKFSDYCKDIASFFDESSVSMPESCSQSKIKDDLDVHLLNDAMSFESLRSDFPKSTSNSTMGVSKNSKKNFEFSYRVPRQIRFTKERASRPSSSKVSTQGLKVNSTKSNNSFSSDKRKQHSVVSRKYQDQAFGLIIKKLNRPRH